MIKQMHGRRSLFYHRTLTFLSVQCNPKYKLRPYLRIYSKDPAHGVVFKG